MLKLKENSLNINSSRYHRDGSESPFAEAGVSPDIRAVSEAALLSHPYKNYFIGKLNNIKRLEKEIFAVEKMQDAEYRDYCSQHCPLLKSKSALISNNLFFVTYYRKQIENVYREHNG